MSEDGNQKLNNGTDLSGLLKDSDTGVKFQDTGWRAMKYYRESATPKIIQWTTKYSGGLIKNEKQAQYALLGFVGVAIIISLFLFFSAIHTPSPPPANQIIKVAGPEGER